MEERYLYARRLMRYLFFFRLRIYSRASVGYDPRKPGWTPEAFSGFYKFYQAAEVMQENGMSPREYLAALITYRRKEIFKESQFSSELMFGEFADNALEAHLENKRLYGGLYCPSSLHEFSDPEEEYIIQQENVNFVWKQFLESSDSPLEALYKIFSTEELAGMFPVSFLNQILEFRAAVEQNIIVFTDGRYTWITPTNSNS